MGRTTSPRTLTFQPHDLLKAIGRATGGRDYNAAARREWNDSRAPSITTNIRAKRGQKDIRCSGWIDQWEDLIDAETKESRGMTLTVSDWFYRGVTEDGGVLSIDPAYFSITGGRRNAGFTESARKHAGGNGANGFAISMPVLCSKKSGAEGTYRRFKFEILRIIARNDLPGFFARGHETGSEGEPLVHMVKRVSSSGRGWTSGMETGTQAARKASSKPGMLANATASRTTTCRC